MRKWTPIINRATKVQKSRTWDPIVKRGTNVSTSPTQQIKSNKNVNTVNTQNLHNTNPGGAETKLESNKSVNSKTVEYTNNGRRKRSNKSNVKSSKESSNSNVNSNSGTSQGSENTKTGSGSGPTKNDQSDFKYKFGNVDTSAENIENLKKTAEANSKRQIDTKSKKIASSVFEKAYGTATNGAWFGGGYNTYKNVKSGQTFGEAFKNAHSVDGKLSGKRLAGSYLAASSGFRLASGGGVYKDKNGNTNIIGLPIV